MPGLALNLEQLTEISKLKILLPWFAPGLGFFPCLARAGAQLDPWEFEVYPYATESRGGIEMETDNAVVANGHSQAATEPRQGPFPAKGCGTTQDELTYGLTDRIEAAAYLLVAQPGGHGFWWAATKYRLRGRLFDEDVLPVNLGWYAELEWHKTPQFDDADLELELRADHRERLRAHFPDTQSGFREGSRRATAIRGLRIRLSHGAYYRWMRYLSPGVEFYGGAG